jgi:hypothetical protein
MLQSSLSLFGVEPNRSHDLNLDVLGQVGVLNGLLGNALNGAGAPGRAVHRPWRDHGLQELSLLRANTIERRLAEPRPPANVPIPPTNRTASSSLISPAGRTSNSHRAPSRNTASKSGICSPASPAAVSNRSRNGCDKTSFTIPVKSSASSSDRSSSDSNPCSRPVDTMNCSPGR